MNTTKQLKSLGFDTKRIGDLIAAYHWGALVAIYNETSKTMQLYYGYDNAKLRGYKLVKAFGEDTARATFEK